LPAITLTCPAKINLFLTIQGKRPDGYHDLGTLFQTLDFGDTLQAEPWDRVELRGAEGIPGNIRDNLILKAVALLQNRYSDRMGPGRGILFTLTKHLPFGAGLGGGSSNGAIALILANRIWGLSLKPQELHELGCELGSDVPFFLQGGTAFGEGRGEMLTPAPKPFPFHVVVATPACQVETAWAYQNLGPAKSPDRWHDFKAQYSAHCGEPAFYSQLHNDFEEPIAAHFPEIQRVREILRSFKPVKAMLTGSGASLFALFTLESDAKACLEAVQPHCRFSTLARFSAPSI